MPSTTSYIYRDYEREILPSFKRLIKHRKRHRSPLQGHWLLLQT